jgi:ABC-type nitrate/sulfonate/bicarbonate transport system substrate-binding protein
MIGRRQLLRGLIAASASPLAPVGLRPARAEPPPETTRIRLVRLPAICVAPEYVAEDLLRAEGFTDVQYVRVEFTLAKGKALITGQADITSFFEAPFISSVDAGEPVIVLAGVHVGCVELFATERIPAIRTRSPRSARYARCSRPPTSAPASRNEPHASSPIEGSSIATTMLSRRCAKFRATDGGSRTQRTPFVSTRFASARRG